MKKWKKILKSRKGETLTETLVGVLIVGMATAIMVAGIASAVSTNRKVKTMKENVNFTYTASETNTQTLEITDTAGTWSQTIAVTESQDDKQYVWFETK